MVASTFGLSAAIADDVVARNAINALRINLESMEMLCRIFKPLVRIEDIFFFSQCFKSLLDKKLYTYNK
jgi:hypothetical protein